MIRHQTIGHLLDESSIADTSPYRCMYCGAESTSAWAEVRHQPSCVYLKARREWDRYRNYRRLRNRFALRK